MNVKSTVQEMTKFSPAGKNEKRCRSTENEELDVESFKKAVDGIDEWFVEELKKAGYDDGQELVDAFERR